LHTSKSTKSTMAYRVPHSPEQSFQTKPPGHIDSMEESPLGRDPNTPQSPVRSVPLVQQGLRQCPIRRATPRHITRRHKPGLFRITVLVVTVRLSSRKGSFP
jgi:hypothetical protein